MSGKYSSLPPSVTNKRTARINVLFKNNGPVPLRALWLNFKGDTKQYATVQPGRCYAQDTYSTHTWILEDESGNIWATYNGAKLPRHVSRLRDYLTNQFSLEWQDG